MNFIRNLFSLNISQKKIFYARVSSERQTEGKSLQEQKDIFRLNGAKEEEIISHVGSAYSKDNLLHIPCDVDEIYVTDLDRLSRNIIYLEKFKQRMSNLTVDVTVLMNREHSFKLEKFKQLPEVVYTMIQTYYNESRVNAERTSSNAKRKRELWENTDREWVALKDHIQHHISSAEEMQEDLMKKKIKLSISKIRDLKRRESDDSVCFLIPCKLCERYRSVSENLYNNYCEENRDFQCSVLNCCDCDALNFYDEIIDETGISDEFREASIEEEGKLYKVKELINSFEKDGIIYYNLKWKGCRKIYTEPRDHLMRYIPDMIHEFEK